MSKVTASTDFDRLEEKELKKHLAIFAEQLLQALNGNLDFATNFNCKLLSITFSAAGTDTALPHGLGRVHTGYIVYSRSAGIVIYDGAQASTSTTLYLRATATGTASLIVF